METTKRFPQELGNLAGEREIPTFPQPILVSVKKKKKRKNERGTTAATRRHINHRPEVSRSLGHLDRQE